MSLTPLRAGSIPAPSPKIQGSLNAFKRITKYHKHGLGTCFTLIKEIIDIVEHTHLSSPLICNETGKGQLWGTPGATNLNSELGAEESQQAPTFVDVNAAAYQVSVPSH